MACDEGRSRIWPLRPGLRLLLAPLLLAARGLSGAEARAGVQHGGCAFVAPAPILSRGDCGQRIFAQASMRPCRRGQVAMRIKRTSPEEKERATRDKDINEKKSQMYLQQRVAYVRQLRERNRLQFQSAVEAPKANRQWRQWKRPAKEGEEAPATQEAQTKPASPPPSPRPFVPFFSTPNVTMSPLSFTQDDFAPLTPWRNLKLTDGTTTCYNEMKGEARYVIVLAEASFTTTPFFDCLKRLSIVPADVASVVGVTVLSPGEMSKAAKKAGLPQTPTQTTGEGAGAKGEVTVRVLSDEKRDWLRAHRFADRSVERALFVMETRLGTIVRVYLNPPPGAVNECVIEAIGDWRKAKSSS